MCHSGNVHIGSVVSACKIVFAVEDADYAIPTLKDNKAVGPGSLTAENLQHVGNRLPVLLTKVFNTCLVYGFVPDDFDTSLIVPVPKGDLSKLSVFKGYRPVLFINIY